MLTIFSAWSKTANGADAVKADPAAQDDAIAATATVTLPTSDASDSVVTPNLSSPLAVSPTENFAFTPYPSSPLAVSPTEAAAVTKQDDVAPSAVKEPPASPERSHLSHLKAPPVARRFSFRSLGFFYGQDSGILSSQAEHEKEEKASDAAKRASVTLTRSERRARASAIALRTVIIGHAATATGPAAEGRPKPISSSQLKKIKSELQQPKTANRVIAQLRALPLPHGPVIGQSGSGAPVLAQTGGPIHAVCLAHADAEVDALHFSKLTVDLGEPMSPIPSVASASLNSLIPLFNDLHIVSLLSSPDLGLGQTADGDGILAGALPTADAVMSGVMQITPQLFALGYATGKAIVPNHAGIYPPLDRMSVITYWWGMEIAMPEATMKYLDGAKSISHAFINFLTALSIIDNGVREILPFIRYISQFMDFEWNAIKAQDKGKGVVCAATWIMPVAMVPRTWDFPNPPVAKPPVPAPPSSSAPDGSPSIPSNVPATQPARTGAGYVNDILPSTPAMLPALLVTPATLPRGAAITTS